MRTGFTTAAAPILVCVVVSLQAVGPARVEAAAQGTRSGLQEPQETASQPGPQEGSEAPAPRDARPQTAPPQDPAAQETAPQRAAPAAQPVAPPGTQPPGATGPPPAAAPVPPPTVPPATLGARTFTAPTGLLLQAVRPERVIDFETVVGLLQAALEKATDPTVRAQARGWRMFKATEPGPNATVLYVFLIDPALPGADYGWGPILADAYPERIQEIWKLYQESLAPSASLLNLVPVQPPPVAPATLAPAPTTTGPVTPSLAPPPPATPPTSRSDGGTSPASPQVPAGTAPR